jgi:ABC-type transport system substrate-binding protein
MRLPGIVTTGSSATKSRRCLTARWPTAATNFKGELAEDMNLGDMSVTFKLKKGTKFHDGAPVTARDVKWSLDRAVTVGGFPTVQMKAGSLVDKEQFVVVDDGTIRIHFAKKGESQPAIDKEQ